MMRPMKLAGSELMFGEGSLAYIKTIKAKKVSIVIGGHSMEKSGMLAKVEGYFKETGAETMVIRGVEPDPSFETVLRGRNEMLEFEPDLIVGLGGGSAMDAAKAMWIFYEHPELTQMEDILPPNEFPKLRGKARMCCIPSTSGTASEVSRSIVISDNEKRLPQRQEWMRLPMHWKHLLQTVQIICQIFLQARQPRILWKLYRLHMRMAMI